MVCAGDISDWGAKEKETLDALAKAKKPMILIPGNHEFEDSLRELSKKYDYIIYLHKGSYQFDKYLFFGYGTGGFAERSKDFERTAKQFKKTIKKKNTVTLITHGPPYGTKLDFLPGLGHRGCKSIMDFIKDVKPVLHISGHLHETSGNTEVIGNTVLVNPGPNGKIIEL
jgi:Icc-related predicted phosphoesterase